MAEQVGSARGRAEPRAGVHGTAPPRVPFIQLACRPRCAGNELHQDGEDQKRGALTLSRMEAVSPLLARE